MTDSNKLQFYTKKSADAAFPWTEYGIKIVSDGAPVCLSASSFEPSSFAEKLKGWVAARRLALGAWIAGIDPDDFY